MSKKKLYSLSFIDVPHFISNVCYVHNIFFSCHSSSNKQQPQFLHPPLFLLTLPHVLSRISIHTHPIASHSSLRFLWTQNTPSEEHMHATQHEDEKVNFASRHQRVSQLFFDSSTPKRKYHVSMWRACSIGHIGICACLGAYECLPFSVCLLKFLFILSFAQKKFNNRNEIPQLSWCGGFLSQ